MQVADSLIIYVSGNCGMSWTRVFADAENGNGNFVTHPMVQGFIPSVADDWCSSGWGAPCISLTLDNWAGLHNDKIAFATYSLYGNPLYVTNIGIDGTVGIMKSADDTSASLRVVPNPASKSMKVFGAPDSILLDILLLDRFGKPVFYLEMLHNGEEVRLPSLVNGVYLLKAKDSGKLRMAKVLLIQR